jgi:hypothetical protein
MSGTARQFRSNALPAGKQVPLPPRGEGRLAITLDGPTFALLVLWLLLFVLVLGAGVAS